MTAGDRSAAVEEVLVAALAAGATQAQAGAAAGVSERTVRRRLEGTDFAARVTAERAALVTRTAARLGGLTGAAVDALADLLAPGVAEGVKLRAALGVLESARIWRAAVELEDRLGAVEAALPSAVGGDR